MKVIANNCWSTILDSTAEELSELHSVFLLKYRTFAYDKKTKRPKNVERTFNMMRSNQIPTGWVGTVLQRIKGCEFEDARSCAVNSYNVDINSCHFPKLWDHQRQAIDECKNVGRGVIAHATGAGKTTTFARLIAELQVQTLIVVPNLDLLNQTFDVMSGYFGSESIGRIGGRHCDEPNKKLATVATPVKFMNHFEQRLRGISGCLPFGCIIFDEAHHVNLSSFWKTTLWYRIAMGIDAFYRFGFTATPGHFETPSRKLLTAATGKIIHSVGASSLIQKSLLAPAEVLVYDVKHEFTFREWSDAYDNNILGEHRNNLIVSLVRQEQRENRSVLVVVDRVEKHGKRLAQLLPESVFLYGGTDADTRREQIMNFDKNGGVLIGTIFGEGIDLPTLDTIIIASGGKSIKLTTQRMGRALRIDKNNPNKKARIIDFFDKDHGVLTNHSRSRLSVYESESAFVVRRFDADGKELVVT